MGASSSCEDSSSELTLAPGLGRRGLLEEALEEAHQRGVDLRLAVDREGAAGPLGLAGVERSDQRHLAARLHRDDRAVAPAGDVELHRAHVLVVDAGLGDGGEEVRGTRAGRGALEAAEAVLDAVAQLVGDGARAGEVVAEGGRARAKLATERLEAGAEIRRGVLRHLRNARTAPRAAPADHPGGRRTGRDREGTGLEGLVRLDQRRVAVEPREERVARAREAR